MSQQEVSIDRVRMRAIVITAGGTVLQLNELENVQTTKTDDGEAGSFTFEAPLGLNLAAAQVMQPMDLVAIYVGRNSTAISGSKSAGMTGNAFPELGPNVVSSLTYGAAGAAVTKLLGTDACLMIGMVDDIDEEQIYDGTPGATFTVSGRDLTKIFLDNDTFVPYTVASGVPVGNLLNIVVRRDQSGPSLLLHILDVFCKKDASAIAAAIAASQVESNVGSEQLAQIAAYGYPYDQFVDISAVQETLANNPSFLQFGAASFPNYSVQSGSVWANVLELRNWPIARMYVNELGKLIFDDTFTAWTSEAAAVTIMPGDIRALKFSTTDADMVTAMTVAPAQATFGQTEIAALVQTGRSRRPTNASTIKRFGYRWYEFISQYDSVTAQALIESRFKVLWLMRNALTRAQITVKGDPKYRVGIRALLATGGASPATQFKTWYVMSVQHNSNVTPDYTTTMELRYGMPFSS